MKKLRGIGLRFARVALCAALLTGCADRLTPLERVQKDAHERHEAFVECNREEAVRSRQRMEEHVLEGRR